jgi:exosortase/archaeosortase family protein
MTIGLLKGSLLRKTVWFILSVAVGLSWNINRLVVVIIIAYRFGLSTFSFTHYFLGPFIDFVWVVSMWALGMSSIQRKEIAA